MINTLVVQGNLTRDPEFKTVNGKPLTKFSIAYNSKYTSNGEKKERVDYFEVEAWGKLAENISAFKVKGAPVLVQGRLKQERWKNAEGHNFARVCIVAENVSFLPSYKQKQEVSSEQQPDIPGFEEGTGSVGFEDTPVHEAVYDGKEEDIPY